MERTITRSTKTYDHNIGLSCCFRQWRATSHCNRLHGYALKVKLVFRCKEVDENGWVMDFGGLKGVKLWLESQFDHKTLVADDDPLISTFKELQIAKMIDLVIVEAVGCENFANMIFFTIGDMVDDWTKSRVWLEKVEVHEHNGNSAEVERDYEQHSEHYKRRHRITSSDRPAPRRPIERPLL